MKIIILFTSFLFLNLVSCNKKPSTPECIKNKITQFGNVACPKGASVKEYKFEKEIVFVFDMGNCGADFFSDVYNSDCKLLGSLGGIIGNTKINGVEFSTAEFLRTVWKR